MAGLGEALDIDKARGKGRNRIHRIGIELEGGWRKVPPGTQIGPDGSVQITRYQDERLIVGELSSPPLSLDPKDEPIYWTTWLKKFYPSHVNETCGMHVHLSFKLALTYERLMTPQ